MHERPGTVAVFAGGGTGGHLYPALALADALTAVRPDVHPWFIGARRGVEATVLPMRQVDHVLLPVRGLVRGRPWANVGVVADLARAVGRVRKLFKQLSPGLVVVTGGYAGAPAGLVAGLGRVPLALWEGNSYPGFTVRKLARWADQIHVGFPEAISHLPAASRPRARVSGTPIRPPVEGSRDESRHSFGLDPAATVVLAVGGSQGSVALNELWLDAVAGVESGALERPQGLQVLWATGAAHESDVTARLRALGAPRWVRAVGYIHRIPDALRACDVAVGRAGASSTSEFLAWGIPTVLVPLPTSAEGHQEQNARALDDAGVSVHLPQAGLTGAELWRQITGLVADTERRAAMARRAMERGRPHAAADIARELAELLPPAEVVR